MSEFESGAEFLHDWRGNDIGVFTRVLHKTSAQWASFRIGTVVAITKTGRLSIKWTEGQDSEVGRDLGITTVEAKNVTVWREGPN